MKKKIIVGALAVSLGIAMAGNGYADTISLTGTIRDFSYQHPDFQYIITGLKTGMVAQTLGADKNPVYIGTNGYGGVHSSDTFNQWYNDVAGVNQSTEYSITLDNTLTSNPDVYTYDNTSFFPIDNQLGGNEVFSHNFHFTYEIHAQFTYQGTETFSFRGDDDVWVYLNNQLAVDLGGVHGAKSGSVALDTLGLTVGNTYDFDMFFAERHTSQSNFRIDTSLALNQPDPTPTPTPEPATLLLFGSGLAGLATFRSKKK